jgi:hypothetical protein
MDYLYRSSTNGRDPNAEIKLVGKQLEISAHTGLSVVLAFPAPLNLKSQSPSLPFLRKNDH